MNKRQTKKQRRLKAVRLLEEMNQHECAFLYPGREGKILMVLRSASVTINRHISDPYMVEPWVLASMAYETVTIEGEVSDMTLKGGD